LSFRSCRSLLLVARWMVTWFRCRCSARCRVSPPACRRSARGGPRSAGLAGDGRLPSGRRRVLALAWRARSALFGRWALASAVCLALVGLGLIATGLTRIDVAQADGSAASTASGMAHELAGYVVFLGMIPGAFALSGAFRRDPRLARAAFAARLFAWGLVIALVLAVAFQRLEMVGFGQRLFLAVWLSWLIFVGLQLRTAGRLSAPGSNAVSA